MRILVTGGAGFIGSALVRHLVSEVGAEVLTVDKLTYAGNLASLKTIENAPNHRFAKIDICDRPSVVQAIGEFKPTRIMHLAAESHVDRSITGSADFINTNIVGTYTLLEAARHYWADLPAEEKAAFRFLHVSTDEVYGSLGPEGLFHEETPTTRPRPTRRRRRPRTTWRSPGTGPTDCRWWSPTAPTTTGPITSRRS